MSKSIIFAGYTRVNGKLKFRTATTESRVHQLEALGETDIHMIRIDPVFSKGDAARALLGINHANGNVEVEQLYIKVTPGAKINKKEVIVKVPPKFLQELVGAKITTEEAFRPGTAKERREANKRLMAQYEEQMAL